MACNMLSLLCKQCKLFASNFYASSINQCRLRKKIVHCRVINVSMPIYNETGRTARCRCKFWFVPNFTIASYVRFPCHSTAFLLISVCRLQWIICQKVIIIWTNQSDLIFNVDKYITWSRSQLLPSSLFTAKVMVVKRVKTGTGVLLLFR